MKVTTTKRDSFRPVSITITMESKSEVDAMYSLFNYSPVCYALRDLIGDPELDAPNEIRETIKKAYGEMPNSKVLSLRDLIKEDM